MKKTIKALIALMLVFSTIFCLTSCSVPELDLEDAKENLEDEDYYVVYSEDGSVGVEERIYASKEDSDFLYVYIFETRKMAKIQYQEFKLQMEMEIEYLELEIKSVKHILNRFEDELSDEEIDEYEDRLDDLEEELKLWKKEVVLGKRGKTVWFGTKTAVKDSKG